MNRKQLEGQVGYQRRLRPVPRVDHINGREVDDAWTVVSSFGGALQMKNIGSGVELNLGHDHVHEFRTPDFLILKSNVILRDESAFLEPIVTAPKVVLVAPAPLPLATQSADGTWTLVLEVHPSRDEPVRDVEVNATFDVSGVSGEWEVCRKRPQDAFVLLGWAHIGRLGGTDIGFRAQELPRNTYLLAVFTAPTPFVPTLTLTPRFKYE